MTININKYTTAREIIAAGIKLKSDRKGGIELVLSHAQQA